MMCSMQKNKDLKNKYGKGLGLDTDYQTTKEEFDKTFAEYTQEAIAEIDDLILKVLHKEWKNTFKSEGKSWPPTDKKDIDAMREQLMTIRRIMIDPFDKHKQI